MSIGEVIAGKRKALGLTQKELAEKLGIDKHVISEMERGVRPVSLKMARALGKVFGHNYKNFLPEN